jgi:hypothetical protein
MRAKGIESSWRPRDCSRTEVGEKEKKRSGKHPRRKRKTKKLLPSSSATSTSSVRLELTLLLSSFSFSTPARKDKTATSRCSSPLLSLFSTRSTTSSTTIRFTMAAPRSDLPGTAGSFVCLLLVSVSLSRTFGERRRAKPINSLPLSPALSHSFPIKTPIASLQAPPRR